MVEESLKQKVRDRHQPEPNTGCWLWWGTYFANGYGVVKHRKKMLLAHRVSYETYTGEIPEGLCVLHKCDTPACVNPEHLFLGTTQENTVDRDVKGRQAKGLEHGRYTKPEKTPKGEMSGASKLKEADIVKIRDLRAMGLTYASIAKQYNVMPSTIHCIIAGRTWKDVK